MSFLTPLYLLGALAVTLPVVLHMIRRTPRGRQEFSSVMFLEPSPPRITKRSMIEHWLLLLLRAAAVCLLALAFARPFLRLQDAATVAGGEFREVVVLLDTSASMQRDGLWEEAVARVLQIIDAVAPLDRLELLTFDRQPQVRMDVEQWTALDPEQRVEFVEQMLGDISPDSASTDLGRAVIEAAERIDDERETEGLGRSRKIIVVSDLQEGSRVESLQSYQWPTFLSVELSQVGKDLSPNNAGLHAVFSAADGVSTKAVRVRVTNAAGSRRESFTVRWDKGPSLAVVVPRGKSRIVTPPTATELPVASRLILDGDDHPFDNTCFVGAAPQKSVNVRLLSQDAADDTEQMRFYLERAFAETPQRKVTLTTEAEGATPPPDEDVDLFVMTTLPAPERLAQVRTFVSKGGTALVVPSNAGAAAVLYELLELAPPETVDAEIDNYAMLSEIDFTHPLFQSLDQPRFSDFTKVRFWKHRRIDVDKLPELRVLARFDDGDIAIGEIALGEGRVVFLTSGWQPEDSQLALSTKFVPMLNGLLDNIAGLVSRRSQFVVGDPVDLSALLQPFDVPVGVITPAGENVPVNDVTSVFTATKQPGLYEVLLSEPDEQRQPEFVVNLDSTESLTDPLSIETFRTLGVPLPTDVDSPETSAEAQRQLHNSELESQQKLWRWVIIGAMILLLAETLLAARVARLTRRTAW